MKKKKGHLLHENLIRYLKSRFCIGDYVAEPHFPIPYCFRCGVLSIQRVNEILENDLVIRMRSKNSSIDGLNRLKTVLSESSIFDQGRGPSSSVLAGISSAWSSFIRD